MSGRSRNYIYMAIDGQLAGQMLDTELNDLMKDVSRLAHNLEWAECGDYDMETYHKTVAEFKAKWFNGDRQTRLRGYVDRAIINIRAELYQIFDVRQAVYSERQEINMCSDKYYLYRDIDEYLVGQMWDNELDDMMKDISELARELENGEDTDDYSDYFRTVDKFKEKWFKTDRQTRLKSYIDSTISNVKDELYKLLGVSGETANQ